MMEKQVCKNHYNFLQYVDVQRFSSFYYQIREIYEIGPSSVLEIGAGNGIVKKILEKDFVYKTMDLDSDLCPDYTGDISKITQINKHSFDMVCAFQVLEHIPFEKFEDCLLEMGRISKKYVFISLPIGRAECKFEIKIPLFRSKKINLSIPLFFMKHSFDGQHYREIGKKGYSKSKIKKILSKYFMLVESFVPYENTYHQFYLLKKK